MRVAISEAQGLLCAEEVVAEHALPGFDQAAVDGYAVRSVDVRTAAQEPVQLSAGDLIVISYAGNGTVYSFKPESPGDDVTFLKPQPAVPRPGITAVLPVDYWRNENDFLETVVTRKPYQFVSPDGTTFFPAGEDFVSGELYYGSKLNDALRAFGLAPVVAPQATYVSDESGEVEESLASCVAEGVNYAQLEFALGGVFANVIGLTADFAWALLQKLGNDARIQLRGRRYLLVIGRMTQRNG